MSIPRLLAPACALLLAASSALVGASRPEQLDENLAALDGPAFDAEEIEQIDAVADSIDVDLWAGSATA